MAGEVLEATERESEDCIFGARTPLRERERDLKVGALRACWGLEVFGGVGSSYGKCIVLDVSV